MNRYYVLVCFSFLLTSLSHANLLCKYFPESGPMKQVIIAESTEPVLITTLNNVSYFVRSGYQESDIIFIDAFHGIDYEISNAIFTVAGSDYISVRTYLGSKDPSGFERYLSCRKEI